MAKKKQKPQTAAAPEKPPLFNQPFESLARLKPALKIQPSEKNLKKQKQTLPSPLPTPIAPPDESLFLAEMADVTPLSPGRHHPKTSPPPLAWDTPQMPNEDLEVLQNLADLVSGKAEFDILYSEEYVECQTRGLPPGLMEQLRAGRIPFQNHLDLHGLTRIQAEASVTRFILDSVALGRRCVLLVHGRGLGSKDGIPVLKRNLESFLLGGPARKHLLAFTSATPVDGGLGASYILLRG